jgi:indole-3-glycerol phosphate synthase
MSLFLERMQRSSTDRLEKARSELSVAEQRRRALDRTTRGFPVVEFAVIAEVKPKSPSEGDLGHVSPVDQAKSYQAGGASAISVLTEPTEFGGSLELLEAVAATVPIPIMRKDFLVDPYQVWEARAHGADGVLAIARMFQIEELRRFVDAAAEADLFVLVEAFDIPDLELIGGVLGAGAQILLGVNSRDLETLKVRRDAHHRLARHLPPGVPAIAESGIDTLAQVRDLSRIGYKGVLVGTALMKSEQPGESVREMIMAALPV